MCFERGEDVFLIDNNGKRYTDFLSGIAVNCLGYSDAGFKQALKDTVDSLLTPPTTFTAKHRPALQLLCKASGYDNVFLANSSGAEAMEGALLARKTPLQ